MIASAVGIPEQYFGDISSGNLATARTVELPMVKMFESYQKVWADTYKALDEFVLEKSGVKADKWAVDRDFPVIAPRDVLSVAQAMTQLVGAFPEFVELPDVKQMALIALGINNTSDVLAQLAKEAKGQDARLSLARSLRKFELELRRRGNGNRVLEVSG
jgi:hypothetical protein